MKQITEDYCSFEVSKLLKEKGFDEKTIKCFSVDGELLDIINDTYGGVKPANWNGMSDKDYGHIGLRNWYGSVSAPTHQMALKWLREVHKINIVIGVASDDDNIYSLWKFDIWNGNYSIIWGDKREKFNYYEQAVEAALKYTLENLI